MKSRLHRARELVRAHLDAAFTQTGSELETLWRHLWKSQSNIWEQSSLKSSGQHTIACDQPPENGGFDEGMTPPELLLASLGSCAGFYAASIFANSTSRPKARASASPPKRSRILARIENFRIEVETPIELTEQHRAGVERAVHHCLIHNTLLHPPQITIAITEAPAEVTYKN